MTDQTPTTEAGLNRDIYDVIIAIEAEARAEALREAAERVRALHSTTYDWPHGKTSPEYLVRDQVLAILSETERDA